MSKSDEFRSKAAELAQLMKDAKSPPDGGHLRRLKQTYTTLADNQEWLERNSGKFYTAIDPPPKVG